MGLREDCKEYRHTWGKEIGDDKSNGGNIRERKKRMAHKTLLIHLKQGLDLTLDRLDIIYEAEVYREKIPGHDSKIWVSCAIYTLDT